MDFELKAAKQKWEREQREKKERAKARLDSERKAREQAARQQEALEAAQRLRRIEAAEAAALAQQQEQEDLELGDGIRFNKVLKGVKIPGDGDKITLPVADFEVLSSQNAFDKGPMFFEISLVPTTTDAAEGSRRKITHAGVMEFTLADGFVGLPAHVWRNADVGPAGEPYVSVRYVRLQKGTYVKLQPEGVDFADVPNHKAVLETKLRHHATLSEGDLLSVEHGGVEYRLRVLELKPASSVSVLETDIEVDVIGTLVDRNSFEEKLVPLTLGKAETGSVEEGKYKYFKFNVDQHLAECASRGEIEVAIQLQIDGGGLQSDADVYVAAHPVLFPSRDQHQWASHNTGSKVICITGTPLAPGVYSVAIYGFRGLSNFMLSVEARPHRGQVSGQKVGAANIQEHVEAGYERCTNCKQLIPLRTVSLHEAYCRRHNIICQHPGCGIVLRKDEAGRHVHCPRCGEASSQDELEKHMKVFHDPLKCSCGAVLEMQEMVNHKATVCPHRRITCQFCGDMVQVGGDAVNLRDRLKGLSQHESSCGSRTDECDICHRAVMLKEMGLHKAAVHSGPSMNGKLSYATNLFEHSADQETAREPVECPVCAQRFEGVDAELLLNSHLDREHLVAAAETERPPEVTPPPVSNFRQTLSVLCPICGMAVHSERDLSSHIDMVH